MTNKAVALIDLWDPRLLIASPMCTAFSHLHNLNKNRRDLEVMERELVEARLQFSWCCHLYRKHRARGAYFLHEHPALAKSWQEPCVCVCVCVISPAADWGQQSPG